MPEMPEVQGLVDFLRDRATGLSVTKVSVANIAALKTYDPPIDAIKGARITGSDRHGKFIDLETDAGVHLIFHLAKAGWLRWYDQLPATVIRPGKTPIALRIGFDDGSGFDLTEAGTKKSLAYYAARSPADVPGIARLGPDPLDESFTRDTLAGLLAGRRTQIKGVLRDQSIVAGIGNAYSDEILHAAKMSPYALAAGLTDAEIDRLYAATRETLAEAVAAASGKPPADLKDAKRRGMAVHGRRGEACPVCGDEVRSVFFADNSLEYCATCQTGGKILADRRLSRLLK
ncbi:Fpg/Nei family DNA glycosylase [Microbacterium sp. EYE_5]|uniref:Fpg/Nei family DNA glycosylase n=1 Tax=unclassified Microbacterium TaxID=2609290 RepID=UPI002002F892|nr:MULTISPECIES: DNA-formamidopyrimidine glycosylase family protein [unclassified Microbacterium]MCK6081578.1 Fpg/Nei family DNA glycosylase [Microbacterium sp. EYE_382]MCK6086848.1 Fpg/Nei family DNA glycosylase [Microbacterium sp. EYE_384]MCK6123654.1 Fpg/Nei family DNA glycosylase [Microbacterium sp. EYE_80]MCK6126563.1 Fpg/Nei family DNA glycosylase [Microbacterium sp. EYE_79]MCK6142532.1 Fpg/Nei family DNA glycosylase [Microbacterium sp. EYE_39]